MRMASFPFPQSIKYDAEFNYKKSSRFISLHFRCHRVFFFTSCPRSHPVSGRAEAKERSSTFLHFFARPASSKHRGNKNTNSAKIVFHLYDFQSQNFSLCNFLFSVFLCRSLLFCKATPGQHRAMHLFVLFEKKVKANA